MTKLHKKLTRVGQAPLGFSFGSDRGKRIVVSLLPGNGSDVDDMIELRPERTQRAETLRVSDIYRYAIQCRLNRAHLEKAREKKAKKDASRAHAKMLREVRRENKALTA